MSCEQERMMRQFIPVYSLRELIGYPGDEAMDTTLTLKTLPPIVQPKAAKPSSDPQPVQQTSQSGSTALDPFRAILSSTMWNQSEPAPSSNIIQMMVRTNALPDGYVANRLVPISSSLNPGALGIKPARYEVDVVGMNWYELPKAFTDGLGKLPWELLIGQGVLVRDYRGNTALISIAEAASLEQTHFPALLECLLRTIESAMDSVANVTTPSLTYSVSGFFKVYLKLVICPTLEKSWAIGLERGMDTRQWLALEIIYTLEWLQRIILPSTTTENLSLISPRLSNIRETTQLRLNSNLFGHPPSISVQARQLISVISEPDIDRKGCWRQRIKAGIVLNSRSRTAGSFLDKVLEVPDEFLDCLVLTAGALWALFNNTLQPMSGCSCTFRSEDGNYITCVKRKGEWRIWHLETDETKICKGKACATNESITFGLPPSMNRQALIFLCSWQAKSVYSRMACIYQSDS
jgi:hypothetical protein